MPEFKIWQYSNYRILITSDSKLRHLKIKERTLQKRGVNNEEDFAILREKVFSRFYKNIQNVDSIIENKYDESLNCDIKKICKKIKQIVI